MDLNIVILNTICFYQIYATIPGGTNNPSSSNTMEPNPYQNNRNCTLIQADPERATEGELDCGIAAFSAAYAKLPPYLHQPPPNRKYAGVIYKVLLSVMERCCGSGLYLCLDNDQLIAKQVEEGLTDTNQVAFPVAKTTLTQILDIDGYRFLPVMETQGSILIRSEHFEDHTLRSTLMGTWPLVFVVIFSAGIAGIIVWVLDRYWNPDDFPKSFLQGAWEGTWWAFVTMTTVGYGDRAPKSIPARVFGLVWMFMGIILMSIFTATLSAALTADTQKQFIVKGSKIGIIRGTLEEIVAYRQGAYITEYRKLRDVLDAVAAKEMDAALVDMNLAMFSTQILADYPSLEAMETIHNSAVYGYILQNQTEEIEKCFAKHTSQEMYTAYGHLRNHIGRLERSSNTVARDTSSRLLSPDLVTLVVLSSVFVIVVLMCVAWEFLYFRPQSKHATKPLQVTVAPKGTST